MRPVFSAKECVFLSWASPFPPWNPSPPLSCQRRSRIFPHTCERATHRCVHTHRQADARRFIREAGNLHFSLKHTPWPHFPFFLQQRILLKKTRWPIKSILTLRVFVLQTHLQLREGKQWQILALSSLFLSLSALPTVKRCLDGKRITALLPTWDACWGLYCVCAWKAFLLKCWRAMAKCRDRVREMQIVLLVSASWLYLDNSWQSGWTLRCWCVYICVKQSVHAGVIASSCKVCLPPYMFSAFVLNSGCLKSSVLPFTSVRMLLLSVHSRSSLVWMTNLEKLENRHHLVHHFGSQARVGVSRESKALCARVWMAQCGSSQKTILEKHFQNCSVL